MPVESAVRVAVVRAGGVRVGNAKFVAGVDQFGHVVGGGCVGVDRRATFRHGVGFDGQRDERTGRGVEGGRVSGRPRLGPIVGPWVSQPADVASVVLLG